MTQYEVLTYEKNPCNSCYCFHRCMENNRGIRCIDYMTEKEAQAKGWGGGREGQKKPVSYGGGS